MNVVRYIMIIVAEIHLLPSRHRGIGERCTSVDDTCYGSWVSYKR